MFRKVYNTIIDFQPFYKRVKHPFHKSELDHLGWLTSNAPCFAVNANNINIIAEPDNFYKTLLKRSSEAKKRITIASLYIGTGTLEKGLIQAISENTNFSTGRLKLSILLDFMRGSRYEINSRTLLIPLIKQKESNCNICLYHTPHLRGIRKKFTPDRFNEIFGLQHMKLYIFDDYLIISGANLSNDYFTNRQDRYFEIKDQRLADFYDGLVSKVQVFSLKLDAENNAKLNENWDLVPYKSSKSKFMKKAGNLVHKYIQESMTQNDKHLKEADTWMFPLIQMGQLGIKQDSLVTERLLSKAPQGTKLFIATGYFNLTSRYSSTIVKKSVAECKVLMAHPNANGFQGAKGPAGGIPAAYSLIANNFYRTLEKEGQNSRITLQEYLRDGWTYHAKGLWYYPINSNNPCLTLIGSPNFGERSVKKDLETQLAIVTENEALRDKLDEECSYLYEKGSPADVNRSVPKWVYPMVYLFKGYF